MVEASERKNFRSLLPFWLLDRRADDRALEVAGRAVLVGHGERDELSDLRGIHLQAHAERVLDEDHGGMAPGLTSCEFLPTLTSVMRKSAARFEGITIRSGRKMTWGWTEMLAEDSAGQGRRAETDDELASRARGQRAQKSARGDPLAEEVVLGLVACAVRLRCAQRRSSSPTN